jgi:hypothetical protein
MTPSGIEQATFRFAAQHLNHCATAVPHYLLSKVHKLRTEQLKHLVKILEAATTRLDNNTDKTEQNAQINEKYDNHNNNT